MTDYRNFEDDLEFRGVIRIESWICLLLGFIDTAKKNLEIVIVVELDFFGSSIAVSDYLAFFD